MLPPFLSQESLFLKVHINRQSRLIYFRGKLDHGIHVIIVKLSFQKAPISKCFCPHKNAKPSFLYSSGLKSILEKLSLRDGLVKLRFPISPGWFGRCLSHACHYWYLFHYLLENLGRVFLTQVHMISRSLLRFLPLGRSGQRWVQDWLRFQIVHGDRYSGGNLVFICSNTGLTRIKKEHFFFSSSPFSGAIQDVRP